MRYIKKTEEPECITNWKRLRDEAEQKYAYDEFDYKRELNEILRAEQHHICCYCQRQLKHYQSNPIEGSHNEHLIPEKGNNGVFEEQMNYHNIYACCIDSVGTKKKELQKRHCGESKGDSLIRGFIQEPNCSSFFKYNVEGEIMPNGIYDKWEDYCSHKEKLSGDIKDATETILTLNLNAHSLVDDRKKDFTAILPMLISFSKKQINQKMKQFESEEYYKRYIDMLLYFMRQKK